MTVKVKKKKMTIGEPEPTLPIEKLADTVSPSIWPPLFGEAGKFESEAITFFHRIHCRECQRMEEQRRLEQSESAHTGSNGDTSTTTTTTTAAAGSKEQNTPVTATTANTSAAAVITAATPTSPSDLPPALANFLLDNPGHKEPRQSPQTIVEDMSLQQTMDKNKESLKRKLMLRRSVNELVDRGIYPPLKAPAAFAEQRKQLERAKTGDLLSHKLKMRPDRQSLVQHHILEDTKIDPSLQDRQKLLKKARLQDSLNDRLANRPGPLELVEGNILETDPELKDAIKEGKLHFLKTSEIPEPGRFHFKEEPEDGSTSEGGLSPAHSDPFSDQTMSPVTIPTPPDITPLLRSLKTGLVSPPPTLTFSQISSPTFSAASPPASLTLTSILPQDVKFNMAMSPPHMSSGSSTSSQTSNSSASSRLARLKKQKSKTPPKSRVIKFHEYKGPPNLVKSLPSPPTMPIVTPGGSDTPYNILLQQQQLLLQWQLEMRQPKNLPIFLSTAQKQVLTGSATSPDGTTILQPQLQQVQLQAVATSSGTSVSPQLTTQLQQKVAGTQGVPQKPVTATIITPAGTPIPVTTPSPCPTPTAAPPPPTIVASIPAAVPANAIPVSRPIPAVASAAPMVTTVMRTVVTTSASAMTPSTLKTSHSNKDSAKISSNNSSSKSNSGANNRPPVTKLDDLKVAELKAECKKRNLPVSGPKPNLLEKLKPFTNEIMTSWKNLQAGQGQNSARPNSSASNISSISSLSNLNSENSLTSPPSVQSITNFNHLINIQPLTPINDDSMSMTMGSPPMSPANSVQEPCSSKGGTNNHPLSPENGMEVTSPTTTLPNQMAVKNQLNSSQTVIPMMIDPLSRPSSVVPMDIDLNGSQTNLALIHTDQNMNPKPGSVSTTNGNKSTSITAVQKVTTSPVTAPSLPPPAPPLPAQIITIRPQNPVASLTQATQQIHIQTGQPGQIQVQPGTKPGHIQVQQNIHTGHIHIQGTQPGQIPLQGGQPTTQIHFQGSPQLSAQVRAQLLQQLSAQMIKLPTSAAQVATSRVTGQPLPSGTFSLAQPRPLVTPVTSTATVARTVTMVPQTRTVVQVSTPGSQPTPTLVQVSTPTSQLLTTVQTPQGLPTQVQVSVPQTSQKALLQQIGQPPVISNEELVKQQQKQIDELQRQLMQYQIQLVDAQQKARQHNEQLKVHLAQAQIQGPDQAKAQQQAQQQAQALAQAQAQVQALQQQAQVQVQAAVQLQAQTQAKALTQMQAPLQIQAQIQASNPQIQLQQSKGLLTTVAGPSQTSAVQGRQKNNSSSPAQTFTVASPPQGLTAPPPVHNLTPSPAQSFVPSPGQTFSASPVQAPTPSPVQMMAPSPAPIPAQSPAPVMTPSPIQMFNPSPVHMMAPSPAHSVTQTPSPKAAPGQSLLSQVHIQAVAPQARTPTPGQMPAPANTPQPGPGPQTITIQPQTQSVLASMAGTSTVNAKPVVSGSLNSLFQTGVLHPSLNLGPQKLILTTMQPNGQQVILTSQPNVSTQGLLLHGNASSKVVSVASNKPGKATVVQQLNGINTGATKSPSSLPGSPVSQAKLSQQANNPFFTFPLKEPPKYDEAIKNKQSVLMLQPAMPSSAASDMGVAPAVTSSVVTMSPSNLLASIKSEYVDDVLDILIRNGELPASAAQDPPPTPNVSGRSSKACNSSPSRSMNSTDMTFSPLAMGSMTTQQPSGMMASSSGSMPRMPTSMTSILDSSKLLPSAGSPVPGYSGFSTNSTMHLSPADTVLSIANGLKLSGPFTFSSGSAVLTASSDTPVTTTSSTGAPQLRVVQSSPGTISSIMSPPSNHGSPLGSDSGVGSSVGRKDLLPPLSISPAVSHTGSVALPGSLTDPNLVDFTPFMDWSDADLPDNLLNGTVETDMCVDADDNKDFVRQLIAQTTTGNTADLSCDDFFSVPNITVSQNRDEVCTTGVPQPGCSTQSTDCPSPGSSNVNSVHSEPNLRELGFNDIDMMDPTSAMNIDVSDWLDVVMPPSGLTPTTVNPPTSTFSADPILTPKTQEFLDLFNLVESDLYTPTDNMGLPFDKAMEASTSKS